jgi:hypothetical protein
MCRSDIEFRKDPLVDVLEYMADLMSESIDADWTALKESGVTKLTPVTYEARNISWGNALDGILSSVRASYEITSRGIVVKPWPRDNAVSTKGER